MGLDYYHILGITKSASHVAIKKSYKRLAMKYHPALSTDGRDVAEMKFKEIAESYEVLSDSSKRAVYDQYGEEGLKQSGGLLPEKSFTYVPKDPEEVFKQFFGTTNPFLHLHMVGKEVDMDNVDYIFDKPTTIQQAPIMKTLPVTLENLYTGTVKKMKITKQVLNEDGKTTSSTEKIFLINVMKGWKKGTKVIFQHEGNEGPGISPADVVIVIEEKPHKIFTREGDNLLYIAIITLEKALTGVTLDVPTLDGRQLPIPVNDIIQPGYEIVIPGEGMPNSKTGQKGNLRIQFQIDFPTRLDVHQKQLIKQALSQVK